MGSYGIGPARIAAAAIEQNNDKDGMIWPPSIAPFNVEVIPLGLEDEVMNIADMIYKGLMAEGLEVLFDDRDERPGVKFKDADLIGIPYQVIIGKKGLNDGIVEVKTRKTKETDKLSPEGAVEKIKDIFRTE